MDGNSAAKETRNAPGRQVVTRSCDMCRKKKIRCEPVEGVCLQCIKYRTQCHFTPISTKRKPRRPAGYKNVEELETRLERMEELLKLAVERGKIGRDVELLDQDGFGLIDRESNSSSDGQGETQVSPPRKSRRDSTITVPVSTISLSAKPQGNIMTPDQRPTMIYETLTNHPSPTWQGIMARDVFARRTFHNLPPKSTALDLINEAFNSFNSAFPIFHQQSFMQLFHDQYSESGPSDPSWWACINVVLSMAHRFRAMRTLETGHENSQACGYMQNALGVVTELTMLHYSLPAVQALLGMTIILQGTPNPRLCSVLVAAAMRLAQTMGLHRKNQDLNLTEAEIEQRRRVFWIAYFLDKDLSLRMGQPPAQDDDDMDVDLPSEEISDLSLDSNCASKTNFFNCRIGLAIIQGQVYKRFYSAKAEQQSEAEQLLEVHQLDACLAAWRSSAPIVFEEDVLTTLQPPICVEVLHKVILRFTYVNCLITIHRQFPQNSGSTAPSDELCINETRKAVQLIQITPHGDYACAWLLIHYFFAAVTTILYNVLRNPNHIFARSDIQLVEPFLGLLNILAKEGKSEEVQRMFEFCQDLNTKATEAVSHVNMRMLCQANKTRGEKESVEDFIMRVECQSNGCLSPSEQYVVAETAVPEVEAWESYASNGQAG